MTPTRRIGLFGGTFDPPHIGHLVAGVSAVHELELDELVFVVASVPWQKAESAQLSTAEHRLAMVRLAVPDRSGWSVSTVEIERGGDSVTADTVEELRRAYGDAELVVIVGSDAAAGIGSWRRGDDLAEMTTLAVIDRPGAVGGRPPARFEHSVVPCPLMDVASSGIRHRVTQGLPIDFLVPDAVRDYIESHRLYRT
ncbi:MAG: nicotinate-nucleotide adenylyltransferase [Acidimicrobiales bacterium]